MEKLVGRKEAGRCSALHERDREVATNAVTGQHDPRMATVSRCPTGRPNNGQSSLTSHSSATIEALELRIDPMQLSQQPILHHPLI